MIGRCVRRLAVITSQDRNKEWAGNIPKNMYILQKKGAGQISPVSENNAKARVRLRAEISTTPDLSSGQKAGKERFEREQC